jgi:myo-inositol 2-dehydrogenase/D-chiro-inositol 1-dehydrogenase
MVRIGIIGCGWVASQHAISLREIEDVEIEAIADVNMSVAKSFSRRFNVKKIYNDYRLLVNDSSIDAVFVTTPSKFHAEQVIYALKNGKAVFSEKPPALTRDEIENIKHEVERQKGIYQIGFNRRYWPVYKKVKDLIINREFKPYSADIKMVDGHMKSPTWLLDSNIVGSYLHDSLIHIFDLVRFLFSEVSSVIAISRRNLYPIDDEWAIILEFSNGMISTITYTAHASFLNPTERLEIYGDHATILTEERWRVVFSRGIEDQPSINIYDYWKVPTHILFGFKEEDKDFIEAVKKGEETKVGINEAYKAMEILFACFESSNKNGVKIEIN